MTEFDVQSLYRETRSRITDLVRDADGDQSVPACPEWTVHNVVSHVTGILADIRAGNLEGVATDPWTAKQVEDRKGRSIDELLDEWTEHAAEIEPQLPNFPPPPARQLCADLYTHEQDIRGALQAPGAREGSAFDNAIDFFGRSFLHRLEASNLGLRVRAGSHTWETGDASTTLRVDPFELFRAYGGRRSVEQVKTWDWTADPEPFIAHLTPFNMRAEALVE